MKINFNKLIMSRVILSGIYGIIRCGIKINDESKNIDNINLYSPDIEKTTDKEGLYESIIKPGIDKMLSFLGLVILCPVYIIICIIVYLDDPGPIFFVQQRVGKDKKTFYLHKFRTMRLNTPHDVPTHQLENPEKYITRVGKFLRNTSMDELPQIWDIFRGKMSIIGPRPALWNQIDLVTEREKYGANSIMPGLTGWAQINGRDELEIVDKAKLDGEYTKRLKQGGIKALFFDIQCFWGTLISIFKRDGIVEGGTGKLHKYNKRKQQTSILVVCQYYYPENFQITPICESLVRDGYNVTVLTGLPNYSTGIVPKEYKHGHRDEYINGVHIIRCYEAGRKKGIFNLALNYATFTVTALIKINKLKSHFDLVLCYQLSPILMGLPAKKYARKHNIPFLHYCCDIWPESVKMYVHDERNLIFKLANTISRNIYRSADHIVVQSTSFINYLLETHGINKSKITYIPAFADETYLKSDFTPDNNIVDFVFLGNLGIAQDLLSVLEAINNIKDIPNFRVHFVGDGVCLNDMKHYVEKHSLNEIVKFYGRRPVEEMAKYYKIADACLVSLKADNCTGLTLPSKVQGYMAAGKPIIAMIDGSAKDVIEDSGCGICVNAGDIESFSDTMKDFIENKEKYENCGKRARVYFRDNFSKDQCIIKLETLIDQMVKTGGRA